MAKAKKQVPANVEAKKTVGLGPMATMSEVARRAGLSRYTVSKVLNSDPTVKKSTRQKVMEACEFLNYVPNPHAVHLVRGRTRIIGLVVTSVTHPFYGEIIKAAEMEANQRGYQLSYQCSYSDHEKEEQILQFFRAMGVCGIAIAPVVTHPDRSLLNTLAESGSVVYFDRYLKKNSHFVMNDNLSSARLVTEHLLSRDTEPVYLNSLFGTYNVGLKLREEGYVQTMKQHGKKPAFIPIPKYEKGLFDNENFGYENTFAWLKKGKKPSAIFCATDILALGALKAIYDCGLKPGVDILVAGHDDQSFSSFTYPTLTTVRQPRTEIGQAAVDIIIDIDQNLSTPKKYIQKTFPSTLIVRESA
jgi:DNA-binding LacI/PurR family transcriptional regulator